MMGHIDALTHTHDERVRHRLTLTKKETAESTARRTVVELLGRIWRPYMNDVVADELVATLNWLSDTDTPTAAQFSAYALLAMGRAVAACPVWLAQFHDALTNAETTVRDVAVWRCKMQALPSKDAQQFQVCLRRAFGEHLEDRNFYSRLMHAYKLSETPQRDTAPPAHNAGACALHPDGRANGPAQAKSHRRRSRRSTFGPPPTYIPGRGSDSD